MIKPEHSRFVAGLFRHSPVKLFAALVLLFVSYPAIQDLPHGDAIEPILVTLVMASAVLAVGERRRTLLVAVALVLPALLARWAGRDAPTLAEVFVYCLAEFVFLAFIVGHLLRFIVRAPRVNLDVLCAGLSGYLLLGMIWIPLYQAVATAQPHAFACSGNETFQSPGVAFYFSFATLSTVGYGDVVPVSGYARMLAIVQAITGLMYLAVLISRLVSAYEARPADEDAPRG